MDSSPPDHLLQQMETDTAVSGPEGRSPDPTRPSSANSTPQVCGHTNDIVSYVVRGTRFDVDKRYTLEMCIGYGSYGIVCSAHDTYTGKKVAIKKISKAFEHVKDTKRVLREIKLLRHFNHENIISLLDILKPPSKEQFEEIYLVTDLMDSDLHKIIASPQPLSDDHCQYFMYQILRGLKTMHAAHVLHRDIKPSNMLVNSTCLLKICDFGLARVEEQSHAGFMTEYVATRWYRAPEVILSWKQYDKAIDVWATGCIFAELLGRKPLFMGQNYINQVQNIVEIIGSPSEEDIQNIGSEQARMFIRAMGYKPKIPFSRIFPHASPAALHLLDRMLTFDPAKRITVDQALDHPYLLPMHDDESDDTQGGPASVFNSDFENWELSKEMCQGLIFNEMLAFHPEARV